MKKLLSLILLLVLALTAFFGCNKEENITVTVWLPTKMTVVDNSGAVSKDNTYTYDEAGNLTQANGTVTGSGYWQQTFTYTEQGNTKEETFYNGDEVFYSIGYEYSYDDAGNLIQRSDWDLVQNRKTCQYDYIYDEAGNNIETIAQYTNSSPTRHIYEHDSKGNVTRQTTYVDEELTENITYTYDEAGRMTEEVHFSPDGAEQIRNNWYYDDAGKLISQTTSYEGQTTDIHRYTYNEEGLLKKHSYETFNVERWRKEYTYDENGRCIRMLSQDGSQTNTYTYEYAAFTVTPQQAEKLEEYLNKKLEL